MDGSVLNEIFNYAAAAGGVAAALVLAKSSVFSVEQQTEALITKFGKYVRTEKEPGLHFKAPAPFNKIAKRVSTALQSTDAKLQIKTSDELFVDLPITVQWEVSDSKKFYFDTNKPIDQALSLVDQSVRGHISGKTFQDLYNGDRNAISNAVIEDVAHHVSDYGITVRRIVVDQPSASAAVREQYDRVKTSQMAAIAAENDGKANYIREVKKAEAEKQRDILRGEGAAGYRKKIFEQYAAQINELVAAGTPREEAVDFMKRTMQLDMLREVGEQKNLIIVTADESAGNRLAIQTAANQSVPPRTAAVS